MERVGRAGVQLGDAKIFCAEAGSKVGARRVRVTKLRRLVRAEGETCGYQTGLARTRQRHARNGGTTCSNSESRECSKYSAQNLRQRGSKAVCQLRGLSSAKNR